MFSNANRIIIWLIFKAGISITLYFFPVISSSLSHLLLVWMSNVPSKPICSKFGPQPIGQQAADRTFRKENLVEGSEDSGGRVVFKRNIGILGPPVSLFASHTQWSQQAFSAMYTYHKSNGTRTTDHGLRPWSKNKPFSALSLLWCVFATVWECWLTWQAFLHLRDWIRGFSQYHLHVICLAQCPLE